MRSVLLAVVAAGTVGMGVELVLLEHYKGSNQMIPLGVGAAGVVTLAWAALAPGVVAVRTLQFTMLVYVGTAVVGATFHFGATEVEAPMLAPALMAQLGVLGLLATYRHPALAEPE